MKKGNTTPAAVFRIDGAYCVLATRVIAVGEVIYPIMGTLTRSPSMHSLQIDFDTHIDLASEDVERPTVTHPWRFTNHSCEPNAMVDQRQFVAIRKIAVSAQVSYNYNTTEFSMNVPFPCGCGSLRCLGTIAGFSHLGRAERENLRPWLAPYLKTWMQGEVPEHG